jgi:hypothetical protein
MPRVVSAKAASKAEAPKAPKAPKEEKPKRARSAYTLFCKDKFSEYRKDGESTTAVMGKLAAAWKTLSAAQQKPYQDLAAKEKERSAKEKAAALAEKKANAKPLSSYMRFCKVARPNLVKSNPGKSVTEIASLLGAEWKKLPEAEKKKYKAQYEAEMAKWKAEHADKSA